MNFYCNYCEDIVYKGTICIEEDTSIIFSFSEDISMKFELNYTISMGENPRFLMDVSCEKGVCGPLRCFLEGVKIIPLELSIPKNRKGRLYFVDEQEVSKYSGTMYSEFKDSCYWDEKHDILCLGNPYLEGDTIEFVSDTYAVIKERKLTAIFLKISSLKQVVSIQNNVIHKR